MEFFANTILPVLALGVGFIASSSRYHETKPDYDYIDLGALARNIFFTICRYHITQP